MIYFLLAIIPMVIPFIAKFYFKHEFTIPEMVLACVSPAIVIAIIYAGGTYSEMSDVEVLSGQVTAKERNQVHCRHSYSCNCVTYYTGTGTNKTSHRKCSTCYSHSYDVDWDIISTLGTISIDTEDRQGLIEPKRWTVVNIGDPYAKTSSYVNYVKGAKDSLFNLEKYNNNSKLNGVPEYPSNIFDLYKINRGVDIGANVNNLQEINDGLSNILRTLGGAKQVNIVMAITNKPRDFAFVIRDKWLGGKKNDVIIIIGAANYPKIDWVEVFSWSKNQMVNIKLRDNITELGSITSVNSLMDVINNDISSYFVRKSMQEFEYLESQVQPSNTVIYWALCIGILLSISLTICGVKFDIFGTQRRF